MRAPVTTTLCLFEYAVKQFYISFNHIFGSVCAFVNNRIGIKRHLAPQINVSLKYS